jgi:hypothetical protein
MKKFILIAALASSASFAAFAQGNEFIFTWNAGIPTGGFTSFMSKTSLQGWAIEYRRAITKTASVGGSIGLNVFAQEHDRYTWVFDDVAITAHDWRYAHVVPLLVNAHFNPLRNLQTPWQVFVGAGLGASYVNQEIWAGMYDFRNENWGFSFYPEAGLRYVMSTQTALMLSAQYLTVVNGNFTGDNLSYWNIRLGFSFGSHRAN